jgi:hypothetical protein
MNSIYSQELSSLKNIVRDIDNYSIYANLSSNISSTDSLYYIRYSGDLIKLNCDVKYWGSNDDLNEYIDRIYYNRYDYNYQEMNDYVTFCIVFDEYLHIQDIRFTKRFHDLNDKVRNYILVHTILSGTEGHWYVDGKSTKSWHIYIGRHKFY